MLGTKHGHDSKLKESLAQVITPEMPHDEIVSVWVFICHHLLVHFPWNLGFALSLKLLFQSFWWLVAPLLLKSRDAIGKGRCGSFASMFCSDVGNAGMSFLLLMPIPGGFAAKCM